MTARFLYNQHKEIPGNPSIVKSSTQKLRRGATASSLKALSMEDWHFWKENGYIVVKQAISDKQADETAEFL